MTPYETIIRRSVDVEGKPSIRQGSDLARSGLSGAEPITLDSAGQLIGVTRERVRQLEVPLVAHTKYRLWCGYYDLRREPDAKRRLMYGSTSSGGPLGQIGRASCRERV